MKLTLTLPEPYTAKQTPLSTLVIAALKKRGVRGDKAAWYFTQHSAEWLAKRIWLLDYYMETNPPKSPTGFLIASIEHDYVLPEMFIYWLEAKKQKILSDPNSSDDLIKLVSI